MYPKRLSLFSSNSCCRFLCPWELGGSLFVAMFPLTNVDPMLEWFHLADVESSRGWNDSSSIVLRIAAGVFRWARFLARWPFPRNTSAGVWIRPASIESWTLSISSSLASESACAFVRLRCLFSRTGPTTVAPFMARTTLHNLVLVKGRGSYKVNERRGHIIILSIYVQYVTSPFQSDQPISLLHCQGAGANSWPSRVENGLELHELFEL